MNIPPPSITPNTNNDFILKVMSEEKKDYQISFSIKNDILIINAYHESIEYENTFTLEEIKNVKLFSVYDTIKECLDEIYSGINPEKSECLICNIKENIENIILIIPLRNVKYNKITFTLIRKKNELDTNLNNYISKEQYEYLLNIINEHENTIYDLKIKNEAFQKKINDLEDINFKLQQKINQILKYQKYIKEIEEKNYHQLKNGIQINSKIINDTLEYKISLKKWINKNKLFKTELLYRLSKDEDKKDENNNANIFHKKCDEISPTLILIESKNEKKFGGFTTCTWNGYYENKFDGQTFLFSLNKNKKFKKKYNKDDNKDIYANYDDGPYFGSNDLFLSSNMKICYSNNDRPYSFLENNDLIGKNNTEIEINEVEIYKIIFE